MTISIRKAIEQDFKFMVDAQLAMALETEDMELDSNTVELGVKAILRDPTKGQYFIATENFNPIGMLLTIPEWSDWRNGTILWIHSVFVSPNHRNKGVYAMLYTYLKNMVSTSNDYRGLRLYVDKRNIVAQKVYQKLGMTNEHYELYEWLKS